MNTFENYNKEIIGKAIEQWLKEHETFKGMENDPVINLLLTALSHQAYQIEKNIENYEEKTLRNLRDRIIPHHLTQPMPAFSILQTQIKDNKEDNNEKIVDESCEFIFEKNKKKFTFVPLLVTKIINAECEEVFRSEDSITIELKAHQNIQTLSGISFYFDSYYPVEIEAIRYGNQDLPLIKPNQYNELPFTAWFNNRHWLMKENLHLFGTYDYWQEIFLINAVNLYYIGDYNPKNIPFDDPQNIELEIIFKNNETFQGEVKINSIPVVQVENKDITLNENRPIEEFNSDNGEFLNLLCPEIEQNIEDYVNSFFIRQFGVERYNPKMLLEHLQEIADRYISDYYAFQNIDDLKNDSKIKDLKDNITEILRILEKKPQENSWNIKNNYYAVLRKSINKNLYINYLITSGELANGIKKGDNASKTNSPLDSKKTVLLCDTAGGKNSITDELQKENIAKYYFLTKDKLVTLADIRAFCYKETGPQNVERIDIHKESGRLIITIKLKEESPIAEDIEKMELQTVILSKKLAWHSHDSMEFKIKFI
ncbi:MAG: hypothetical protein LBS69_08780 [Prevotellaceae bacterium]|jgi:hypothetical protein|nr:hypothetical protein [Prevotellaceae bacterium]